MLKQSIPYEKYKQLGQHSNTFNNSTFQHLHYYINPNISTFNICRGTNLPMLARRSTIACPRANVECWFIQHLEMLKMLKMLECCNVEMWKCWNLEILKYWNVEPWPQPLSAPPSRVLVLVHHTCVRMSVCVTYMHTHTNTHARTHTHTQAYKHINTRTHTHTHAGTHEQIRHTQDTQDTHALTRQQTHTGKPTQTESAGPSCASGDKSEASMSKQFNVLHPVQRQELTTN